MQMRDRSGLTPQGTAQESVLVCPRCYLMYNILHRAYVAKKK